MERRNPEEERRHRIEMIRHQRELTDGPFHGDFMNKLVALKTTAEEGTIAFLLTCEDLRKKYNGRLIPSYEEFVTEVAGGDEEIESIVASQDEEATATLNALIERINKLDADKSLTVELFLELYQKIDALIFPSKKPE